MDPKRSNLLETAVRPFFVLTAANSRSLDFRALRHRKEAPKSRMTRLMNTQYTGLIALCVLLGCNSGQDVTPDSTSAKKPVANGDTAKSKPSPQVIQEKSDASVQPQFVNVAAAMGLEFEYFEDRVPGRFFLPEVMGGGVGWGDFVLMRLPRRADVTSMPMVLVTSICATTVAMHYCRTTETGRSGTSAALKRRTTGNGVPVRSGWI